ncbi:hypothetical protein G5V59_02565 [Nocardioides sp. W3-2-3]|uniref:hypothetical protein n=1 Tax=Nocardioides convexus TaxID=2712224 RepID=UPI00241882DC|nr:hypothetical protein [Nocardioides convexus]NGZ99636.1 hypothetical protein [Nocardioides convexus]
MDFGGDVLKPHEVEFVERLLDAGEQAGVDPEGAVRPDQRLPVVQPRRPARRV